MLLSKRIVLPLMLGLSTVFSFTAPLSSCLLATTTSAPAAAPQRWALLVGISNYDNGTNPEDGWRSLNTGADLEHMRFVLDTYYKFKEPGLRILSNDKATQENVIREFREYLVGNAKPGDSVVFYYTGHGFHIPDVNGDETADHEDEVTVMWVPKDKQNLAKKDRRTLMYMLDDTYQTLLKELSDKMSVNGKVQGSITVIFDSCNSGSGAKAVLIPKGREWDDKIDGPRPTTTPSVAGPDVASGWLTLPKDQSDRITFIAGSQSNQFSYMMPDSTTNGSVLTYYLSQFLTNIAQNKPDRRVTYKDMQDSVSAKVLGMGKVQDPQTEGNVFAEIFGDGEPVGPQSLPAVRRVLTNPLRLELGIGSLHGVTVGSHFDIYRKNSDVKKPENKLAELEITAIKSITAEGKISKPASPNLKADDYDAAQAVSTDFHLDAPPLKVFIPSTLEPGSPVPPEKLKALSDAIAAQPFITRAQSADGFDVKLSWCADNKIDVCKANKNQFIYQRASGRVISLGAALDAEPLKKRLLADWRWKRLADLTLPGLSKVHISMVGKNGDPLKLSAGGRIVLTPGDEGQVMVTNNSGEPVFLTLVYLKDSGEIIVFPGPDQINGQQPLSADSTPRALFSFNDIKAEHGVEVESLKIIATPRATDFSGMSYNPEQRKGITNKGPKNPMEDWLFGFVDADPKSMTIGVNEIDRWYIDQIVYEIHPQ